LWRNTPKKTATLTTSINRQGSFHKREFIHHLKYRSDVNYHTGPARTTG
jgi:hypothetical protein